MSTGVATTGMGIDTIDATEQDAGSTGRVSVKILQMHAKEGVMPTTNVTWYSLGFNIVDKQGHLYYGLEGDNSAQQVFVTAQELTALAQMFRDGGQVVFNDSGGQSYFVTERRDIAARAEVSSAGPGHLGPKGPRHQT